MTKPKNKKAYGSKKPSVIQRKLGPAFPPVIPVPTNRPNNTPPSSTPDKK